jgi:hypothetical protein
VVIAVGGDRAARPPVIAAGTVVTVGRSVARAATPGRSVPGGVASQVASATGRAPRAGAGAIAVAGGNVGAHELAPAVLGRVLAGGPTRLAGAAITAFRVREGTAPARGSVGRLVDMFSPRPAGVPVGVRTDRVAPPRMSVAAPVATLEPPAGGPAATAFETDPGGRPLDPGPPVQAATAGPAHPADPADSAHPGGPAHPADPAHPGHPPRSASGAGGTPPPARWRLTDLDPADLAELADLVMERIEGRVRGELERRGRRGVPGVF